MWYYRGEYIAWSWGPLMFYAGSPVSTIHCSFIPAMCEIKGQTIAAQWRWFPSAPTLSMEVCSEQTSKRWSRARPGATSGQLCSLMNESIKLTSSIWLPKKYTLDFSDKEHYVLSIQTFKKKTQFLHFQINILRKFAHTSKISSMLKSVCFQVDRDYSRLPTKHLCPPRLRVWNNT